MLIRQNRVRREVCTLSRNLMLLLAHRDKRDTCPVRILEEISVTSFRCEEKSAPHRKQSLVLKQWPRLSSLRGQLTPDVISRDSCYNDMELRELSPALRDIVAATISLEKRLTRRFTAWLARLFFLVQFSGFPSTATANLPLRKRAPLSSAGFQEEETRARRRLFVASDGQITLAMWLREQLPRSPIFSGRNARTFTVSRKILLTLGEESTARHVRLKDELAFNSYYHVREDTILRRYKDTKEIIRCSLFWFSSVSRLFSFRFSLLLSLFDSFDSNNPT